ncbi:MAG: permease-like cell division protein FtsX [Pygmaiobacter sp.]|nr:permease-like cell division protein FtsX [Pygmaiobacter sp.]
MRASSLSYLLREGMRSIFKNRMISLAAIGVLVACLLLVGASHLLTQNVNSLVGYLESQNEVMVFLDDAAKGEDLTYVDTKLRALDNIASVTFISREEGLKTWMEQLGDDGTLLEWLVEDNPLQNSYRVVLRDLSRMEETLSQIRNIAGVETISASREMAQAVTSLKDGIARAGFAVVVILAGVSLVIVANTIRLTVYSRRKEIGIMKYVGATDTFIRLPFIAEGILLGVISATIAFLLLWAGYTGFVRWVQEGSFAWAGILQSHIVPFSSVASRLYLYFLAGGVGIGTLGSMIFTGKYLKV